MVCIGILSYSTSPRSAFTDMGTRALLAEAALQGAGLVFLDGATCDMERGRIIGERWAEGGWRRDWTTLPDVVVVREGPFTPEQRAVDAWVRRSRPVIADTAIDKLTLHALLAGSPLRAYAIPGVELTADRFAGTLTAFLHRHRGGVVKAADGQRGIGIHFIREEAGGWAVQHDRAVVHGTLDEVVQHLQARVGGRLRYRRYLVQRYIPSLAPDGRAADIRVHAQRRADREWGITRAYVRLAEAGVALTNVSRGGYQGALEGFLTGRLRRPAKDLLDEIHAVTLDAVRLVDASKPLPLSELGVDLAIDGDDRLWIIEVNAFPQASLHEHAQAMHMIGYALAVAGIGVPERERPAVS